MDKKVDLKGHANLAQYVEADLNKKSYSDFLGFQYSMILDLYRILFHAVVIFGPEHDFLFKSASTYCAAYRN